MATELPLQLCMEGHRVLPAFVWCCFFLSFQGLQGALCSQMWMLRLTAPLCTSLPGLLIMVASPYEFSGTGYAVDNQGKEVSVFGVMSSGSVFFECIKYENTRWRSKTTWSCQHKRHFSTKLCWKHPADKKSWGDYQAAEVRPLSREKTLLLAPAARPSVSTAGFPGTLVLAAHTASFSYARNLFNCLPWLKGSWEIRVIISNSRDFL